MQGYSESIASDRGGPYIYGFKNKENRLKSL